MIAETVRGSSLDANQRYLSAQFERTKALLDLATNGSASRSDLEAADRSIASARVAMDQEPLLDFLCNAFHLTAFERQLLILAAGVEMETGIAERCADAASGPAAAYATFGLALATLEEEHWSALSPTRPLRRWRLIELDESLPLTGSPLRIDERILHFLAGINALDPRLRPWLRQVEPSAHVATAHEEVAERVAGVLADIGWAGPVVQLHGDDRDGQTDVAGLVARRLARTLFALQAEDIPASPLERFSLATLWVREHVLLGSALVVDGHDSARIPEDFLDLLPSPLFIAARSPVATRLPSIRFGIGRPDSAERRRLWQAALGSMANGLDDELDTIAAQCPLSARAICDAAAALAYGGSDSLSSEIRSAAAMDEAYRVLEDLAQPIEPKTGWDDLVLPSAVSDSLREIAGQVRLQTRVYDDWGLGSKIQWGLGITALFAGESGTGKTLAAEVMAHELGLRLYRIDLSTVVSKYIGETEKNLRRVFQAAEDSGAILLFDEADALFGRRSDVRDSHDRYANIEVSYLLQRMEAYRGLAILTTNAKMTLDRAFYRRLRFVVQFPFPDAAHRERIWRAVFPPATPLQDIDYRKLARLNVSGGGARNIAINAAFRAARAGTRVSMAHLLDAARAEFAKADKTLPEGEIRGWT